MHEGWVDQVGYMYSLRGMGWVCGFPSAISSMAMGSTKFSIGISNKLKLSKRPCTHNQLCIYYHSTSKVMVRSSDDERGLMLKRKQAKQNYLEKQTKLCLTKAT